MAADEFLARIDRHLDLQTEYLQEARAASERHTESIERLREESERHRTAHERHMQRLDDVGLAIDQCSRRNERVMGELLAGFQKVNAEIHGWRDDTRAWRDDAVEEARAQRAALFAMIDVLRGGGPASAAG